MKKMRNRPELFVHPLRLGDRVGEILPSRLWQEQREETGEHAQHPEDEERQRLVRIVTL